MARKLSPKCKRCRREGEKLFLKGARCVSSKCAIVKRKYPPGVHGVKGTGRITGYGIQLREKQKAKKIYGLLEKQFANYFKRAAGLRGDTGESLLQLLELRLDNTVYRLGLASSRDEARQLVSHGHFLVNNKKVNIPSYKVKPGDIIKVREKSFNSPRFKDLLINLDKHETPPWLSLEVKKLEGKILGKPQRKNLGEIINTKLIVEYYSR
ncbi:MAG: 30S ribosomal protein S4 [Parcubacteria group bacterium CG23_combo_of_CG06-09_8_20_14_all_35_9]|nr:MAG: 30S ribosomal protein S4 [Parcubacteria group bacterium CG23_combo_of_CG06-09_8_20_14_all_35_9]